MFSNIAANLQAVRSSIPSGVELVAVSKFHPVRALLAAYAAGQRLFGESRVQEFLAKREQLPADIRWHFIGHLQTNKVRSIIGKTALIESIDSERLLRLVDDESARAGVTTDILLQLHVAQEETKFGFSVEELEQFFRNGSFSTLRAVNICGLMGMASNTDDEDRIRRDFVMVADCFRRIVSDYGRELPYFRKLSMGMSDDRDIAIACGSNMVRVGTAIFGSRYAP